MDTGLKNGHHARRYGRTERLIAIRQAAAGASGDNVGGMRLASRTDSGKFFGRMAPRQLRG